MGATIAARGGLPWVALHTKALENFDLAAVGDTAELAFYKVIMLAGRLGGPGLVPSDPARLNHALRLDGGVPAVTDAVDRLVDAGLLEHTEDGDLHVVTWALHQASDTASRVAAHNASNEQRRATQLKNNHGKHTTSRKPDCPLCFPESGPESPQELTEAPQFRRLSAKAPHDQPVAAGGPKHAQPYDVPLPLELSGVEVGVAAEATDTNADNGKSNIGVVDVVVPSPEVTAAGLKERLWNATTEAVEEAAEVPGMTAREAYLLMYGKAEAGTAKYSAVKGIGEATLLNVIVSHAAQQLVPEGHDLTRGTLQLLQGLRRDAEARGVASPISVVLDAIEQSMGKAQPATYVVSVIRSKAAELKAA